MELQETLLNTEQPRAPQTPALETSNRISLQTRIAAALAQNGLRIEDFEPCTGTKIPHTELGKVLVACTTRGTIYLLLEPDEKGKRMAYRDGEYPIIVLGDGQIQWHGGESMQVSVANDNGILRDGESIQFQLLDHNGVSIETYGKLAAKDCLRQK